MPTVCEKKMLHLAMFNDMILDCRLSGIYHAIRWGNYGRAADIIRNTMVSLLESRDVDLPPHTHGAAIEKLGSAMAHLTQHQYMNAHDKIRELHYMLISPYITARVM